jgi:ADP-ribosyl-[dinitrogen reductase] hydrolase
MQGCLIGGAVGDAFGYTIEFQKLTEIRRQHGPDGLREPVFQGGRLVVSDDTQMTLFTAQALGVACRDGATSATQHIIQAINTEYLDWLRTQRSPFSIRHAEDSLLRYRELWVPRAPGNTCLSALSAGGGGSPERPINNSKGCGSVMRVAPIGLVPKFDSNSAFELGARAAALTHGHPSGYLSAAVLASVVRDLRGGLDLATSLQRARSRLLAWSGHEEVLKAIDDATALANGRSADHAANVRRLGEGWVGEEALAIAIYAVMTASTYKVAIRIAGNHDGDSDSTASIAGHLWGAAHGVEGIPHAWVWRLDVFDPICEAATAILSCAYPARPQKAVSSSDFPSVPR